MAYTKEQVSEYNRQYRIRAKLERELELQMAKLRPVEVKPKPDKAVIIPITYQPVYCSSFGCGKILTPTESLCGSKCIKCLNEKKVDIMNVLKFK